MQVEEGFRDLKSAHHGPCLGRSLSRRPERLANLLLIAALALLACWLIGLDYARTGLSVITIDRLVARFAPHPMLIE